MMKGKYQNSRDMFGSCYCLRAHPRNAQQTKHAASLFPVDRLDRYKTA
jgi:hypothetical protein